MTIHRITIACILTFMLHTLSHVDARGQEAGRMRRAWDAYQAKHMEEAKRILDSVDATVVGREEYLSLRGFLQMELKDYESLIATGKELVVIAPDDVNGWFFQACGYLERTQFVDFIPPARTLCKRWPDLGRSTRVDLVLVSLGQDSLGLRDSVFTTNNNQIGISLSKAWSTNHVDDGKTLHWFVSLEPINKDNDVFSVGLTLRWVRKIETALPLDGATDVATITRAWNVYSDSMSSIMHMYGDTTLDSTSIRVNG